MRRAVASLCCLLAVQTGCSQDFTWRAVEHMIAANSPNVPSISTDSLAERLSDEVHPYDASWGTLLADSLHAYRPPSPSQ
jgi:hypothetical protein